MCQVDAGGEVQLPELAAMVVWRSRGEAALGVGGGRFSGPLPHFGAQGCFIALQ